MNDLLSFQLVSPDKVIFSSSIRMAVVPGEEGEMGILAHHCDLISTLRPGLVKIYQGDTLTDQFYVSGGFVNVNEQGCSVMAEDCIPLEEIDYATLELSIKEKLSALDEVRTNEEREALKRDLHFANIKMNILNQHHSSKAM